ncbi:hypothetical protein RQP46_011419 [Phenoliferia psychrophenolica]
MDGVEFSAQTVQDALARYVPSAALGAVVDDSASSHDFSEYVQQPDEGEGEGDGEGEGEVGGPAAGPVDPNLALALALAAAPPQPDLEPDLLLNDQHEHHHHEHQQQAEEEIWDAPELQVESYEDLINRRDVIISLIIEQGNIPHLQAASAAAIEDMLIGKQPSWVTLLRRSLSLYSSACIKLGLPVHPITAAKVALYLSRLDEDPTFATPVSPSSAALLSLSPPPPPPPHHHHPHHQHHPADLPVTPLDPLLAPSSPPPAPPPPPPAPRPKKRPSTKKHRKVLKRKTLEQYVNRLTALRTPTINLWRARGGAELESSAGLGMAPVVRDVFSRAEGESAMDVKKRGRQRGNGTGTGEPERKKAKKEEVVRVRDVVAAGGEGPRKKKRKTRKAVGGPEEDLLVNDVDEAEADDGEDDDEEEDDDDEQAQDDDSHEPRETQVVDVEEDPITPPLPAVAALLLRPPSPTPAPAPLPLPAAVPEEQHHQPSDRLLAAAVSSAVQHHFIVSSASTPSQSFVVSSSSSTSLLPPALNAPATTYTLSPTSFKAAEAFMRDLQAAHTHAYPLESEGEEDEERMRVDIATAVEGAFSAGLLVGPPGVGGDDGGHDEHEEEDQGQDEIVVGEMMELEEVIDPALK